MLLKLKKKIVKFVNFDIRDGNYKTKKNKLKHDQMENYKTPLKKAKILAKLATYEIEQSQKTWMQTGVIQKFNTQGQIWSCEAVVQLKTDYEKLGGNGGFEEDIDNDVLWVDRSWKDRQYINQTVKMHEALYPANLSNWMIARYEDMSQFCFIQLVLSENEQPHWIVKMTYGPTTLKPKQLEKLIQETFEHYDRSGDLNFTLLKTKWSLT